MQDNRDEYEPIIATRRSREPLREDTQPLWRLVLALGGGLAVVVLLVWWLMGRSSSDNASTTVRTEEPAPAVHVEQEPAPPAIDSEANADLAQAPARPANSAEPAVSAEQAAAPESVPAVVPDNAAPAELPSAAPAALPPAAASVRFTSPDPQVRFELRSPSDSSPQQTIEAGQAVALAPGTYRVVASGTQLETLEREIVLTGDGPAEFAVELCAEPKRERELLAGRIVEERACASAAQCETTFAVLSEHAEQLVNDREFRAQQCAKWRPEAAPEGKWTLDTKCDGATLATTCRIEISQGACTVTEPRRSARGEACPRAELK